MFSCWWLFPSVKVFIFCVTFLRHQHSTLVSQTWRSPPILRSTQATFRWLVLPGFFVTSFHVFKATVTEVKWFLFFTCSPYFRLVVTHIWAGTPHQEYLFMPDFRELSLSTRAWSWTTDVLVARPLFY